MVMALVQNESSQVRERSADTSTSSGRAREFVRETGARATLGPCRSVGLPLQAEAVVVLGSRMFESLSK